MLDLISLESAIARHRLSLNEPLRVVLSTMSPVRQETLRSNVLPPAA